MSVNRPLISVGIPVYNGERYLRRAIDSVLEQDYDNFELLISDNASADATAKICQEYTELDGRIRYFRNPINIGPFKNFERLVEEAKGTYFTWCAHDDYLSKPDCLSRSIEYLEANLEVVCCASAGRVVYADGTLKRDEILTDLDPSIPWRQARKDLFDYEWSNVVAAVYGVFRRETLAKVSFVEHPTNKAFSIYPEMLFLAQVACHGRIVALPNLWRTYCNHAQSAHIQLHQSLSADERDEVAMGFAIKVRLFPIIFKSGLPVTEQAELVWVALRNFKLKWWEFKALMPTFIRTAGRKIKKRLPAKSKVVSSADRPT